MPATTLTHPSGQTSYIVDDNYTDPWRPHETILIQHGFARHSTFWYHWIPALARNYRVIRRDLRGHGRSSAPRLDENYPFTVDSICDEIIDTLDQLGIERVHFLGESTSGMLGEILAAKHPERLISLTVCSSPTWLPPKALTMFAFGFSDWPTACLELGSRGWGEALCKIPGTMSIPDNDYVRWWVDQVAVSPSHGLAGYARFLSKLDARPYLGAIKVPTLILAPADSAATTIDDQKAIQDSIPGSKLVIINGKGHEIYVDMAIECQQAILGFLDKL